MVRNDDVFTKVQNICQCFYDWGELLKSLDLQNVRSGFYETLWPLAVAVKAFDELTTAMTCA